MRVAVLAFFIALTLTLVNGLPQFGSTEREDAGGRYYPDNSGAYNQADGRYYPDDSGSYRPDSSGSYSGQYIHDNSGAYVHDNLGEYVHDDNPYVHLEGKFGNDNGNIGGSGGFGGGSGGSGGFGGAGFGVSNPTTLPIPKPALPVEIPVNRPVVAPVRPVTGGSAGSGSGIAPAGGFGNPVPLKQGNAAGFYDNRNYAIIRKIEQVEQDGYHYLYETENGILAEEEGHVANKGSDNEIMKAKGFFTYTGPDAIVYTVEYTADENGFVPKGAHLPTPPPIPEAILRSLEYQKSLGEL